MPISRFVAVSLRPASSVLRRTLARTGRVLRLETARLTTDRPRARFSCMTDSLTWAHSNSMGIAWIPRTADAEPVRVAGRMVRGYLLSFLPLRHHRSNAVERVDGRAPACDGTAWMPP